MNKSPKISIIIPVYNCELFVQEALSSILNQNYDPIEIIVVDDGSRDRSARIVKQHPSVRYVYQENLGPVSARNRALKLATGDYISFLDSDDIMAQGFLQKFADFLNRNEEVTIAEGRFQYLVQDQNTKLFITKAAPYYHCFLGTSLYRKSVFDLVGLFDERLTYGDDADWFIRAWENNVKKARIDFTALFYRRHESNITNNTALKNQNKPLLFKLKMQRRRNRVNFISTEGPLKDYLGDPNSDKII